MPNQRKKSKVHLGGYYEASLKEELKRIAKFREIPLSQLVEQLLEQGLKDYKRRHGGEL